MQLLCYHRFGHHEALEMVHEMSYTKCFVVDDKLQNSFANLTQIVTNRQIFKMDRDIQNYYYC